MRKSTLIKDSATREAVNSLEQKMEGIQQIHQVQKITTNPTKDDYNKLVDIINKITNSMKRK